MTEQDLISEQRLSLLTYPPSSPVLHSDIQVVISSSEHATRKPPTLHGTQKQEGIWDVANETQRAMLGRHLTMIGMFLKLPRIPVTAGNVG